MRFQTKPAWPETAAGLQHLPPLLLAGQPPAQNLTTCSNFNPMIVKLPRLPRPFKRTALFAGIFAVGSAVSFASTIIAIPPALITPAASPVSGNYSDAQSVTITSSDSGASIAYTTDGSTPTESGGSVTHGTLYSGPVSIGATSALKVMAFKSGFSDSPAITFSYTIQAATPSFNPPTSTFTNAPQLVTISSTTSGASIAYTTDGSTPTESGGSVTHGTLYAGPVSINATTTLNAIAFKNGDSDSGVATANYTQITNAPGAVSAPTFSPGAGIYTSAQSVTLTSDVGATIRYTTDGSTPTETNGTIYSSPVSVNATMFNPIQAIAYDGTHTDSAVSGSTYTLQVVAPTFSPVAGTYTSVQSVTITSPTSGAIIAYSTTGNKPLIVGGWVITGTLYTGPVTVSTNTTLQAVAGINKWLNSTVTNGAYVMNIPQAATPTFTPDAGTYTSAQSVSISSATSGATIRYTTDFTTPTETNGAIYSTPIAINSTTMLKAIAYKPLFATDSAVANGTYTINLPPAAAPVFSPAAGSYASAQTLTITSPTSDATIRYTTDGSTPTETNGTVYTGPVSVGSTKLFKAIAYGTGIATDSPATSGIYTIISPAPALLNVIYDFTSSNNGGSSPIAGLIQGSDGNFYGTAQTGGDFGGGTVFKTTAAGVLTPLVAFNSPIGIDPTAALVQGTDGNYYGTTDLGGSANFGAIFKLTPSGIFTSLASFTSTNGAYPFANLIRGSDGNFYGTTSAGGSSSDGVVFKITPAGALTTLVSFAGPNGANPFAGLVQSSDGNFYGTTYAGGSSSDGVVFKMTPTGVLTTLVSFNYTNGANPAAALVQGSDGNFYGTTEFGGSSGLGTVFKMTPAGALTTLVSFDGTIGGAPFAALVQGSDGNFYGTTLVGGSGNFGTVFQLTPAGNWVLLVSFDSANGYEPETLVQGSDGYLYGMAQFGGSSGSGLIFQLIIPVPPVAAPVFVPAAGTYTSAQTVTMMSASSGASIRYTTDGSTPTETKGTLYSGPVGISSTTILNAIAYESRFTDSSVTSGTYTINVQASAPTASGGGGGALDDWFLGFLAFAGLWRALTRANHKRQYPNAKKNGD
jgi:uncharacterized repeat protein (TIGR03803 family)